MRLPPSSLLREILSLVLHEAIHMGGGLEPEAIAWQELFSKYFGARFNQKTKKRSNEFQHSILLKIYFRVLLRGCFAKCVSRST